MKPILKWAGGKTRLIPEIVKLLPKDLDRRTYVEPFIGGAALLLHLQPKFAILNDYNSELINVYQTIRDEPDKLLDELVLCENTEDFFYKVRALDRDKERYSNLSSVERAARFIYLNKTCYNGLYRVNSKGEFNTPFGKYKNPMIRDKESIQHLSRYLNTNQISIYNMDYKRVLASLSGKTFVYLDPPYHETFTGYTKNGFDEHEQIVLREWCEDLSRRDIKFLLSNSATPFMMDQYRFFDITVIDAPRNINPNSARTTKEVLIRNYV